MKNNDAPENSQSLETVIRKRYSMLSPSEKKFVSVLLEQQNHLGYYSATELAIKAGVSKSTAARCFRQLGFSDFNEFRQSVLPLRENTNSPLAQMARTENRDLDATSRFEKHIYQEQENLNQLLLSGQQKSLETCVDIVGSASHVWIAGFRNGYTLACYAQALLSNIRSHVTLLNKGDGHFAENLASMKAQDVLILMDFPRRTKLLSHIVQIAKKNNVRIVAFSDQTLSPVTSEYEVVISCQNESITSFNSYIAGLSMVNYLTNEISFAYPEQSQRTLQRIEQNHQLMSDLID
ncbi:MurR/RpiR family transcriptional regulator [Klebsiella indica]|uniref:MurR/RpiR family transcriptional regulator n=1 Tax=Klebsiella indica TaxID=2582917 RepID=A0A5R9LM96_9ENTR|nr:MULTISPECIES: MurR/RpiR family transcriptional regulator [Klebsiella]TLV21987.1 MurR/RpiR family transcriptional regulator [Klebsiella indica]